MTKVYRRTVEIKKTDLPEGLIEKLKILNGLPPHNTMSNIAWNDGYFAKSIENTYGADMVAAAQELVIKPLQQSLASPEKLIIARDKLSEALADLLVAITEDGSYVGVTKVRAAVNSARATLNKWGS